MANYQDVITTQEIETVVNKYMKTPGAKLEKIEDILQLLGFYGECKLIFDSIMSGDLDVTDISESGLKYKLSDKARKRLH